ncbi:hypothetical protein [Salinarimonas ramus]|uniref:Addiction module component n=1 Tax=Salinarimonas ramus TaxID=690164 RepID=A0A917Q9I8_9HYPH|nr:hypothetical protein [Salinarimonas ramus]GGK37790.1 hypothetical protein GCM10011322_26060 [Salinarimonas ramus]
MDTVLLTNAEGPIIDDAWLKREVLPVIERVDRGEEDTVPLEEAFAKVEERYLARKAADRGGE